jgi:hypothetical protein
MVSPDNRPSSEPADVTPIVRGTEIPLRGPVNESFGVPAEVAQKVTEQILGALAAYGIDPATVVFSGYYDAESRHTGKADEQSESSVEATLSNELALIKSGLPGLNEGPERDKYARLADLLERRLAMPPEERGYSYYFYPVDNLPDGEGGPLAYAASGDNPGVGVYDLEALNVLGYNWMFHTVVATPQEIEQAFILEFRPTYLHPGEQGE